MKLNHLLLTACMTLLLFACKNEIDLQREQITVKLTPAFISLNQDTDVPMNVKGNMAKMSVDPNQAIYAIQVYENDSAYYYGVFDKVDSMKIAMTTGKTYRFKVTTYKVGTGGGLKQDVQTDGKYFYLPNKTLLGNKFIKGNALKDINFISSAKLTTTSVKDYPEIDAFYCDKTVTVEKGLANIDFSLLRMAFGVTYTVDGLTNGKLYIIMGNDTTTLTSSVIRDTTTLTTLSPSATSIRLFNAPNKDFLSIFNNANTYADSILVKVQWVGSNGTILNTQGKYKFTRNYKKTINIQLNTTNLNLNFEDWNTATVTDIDGNVYKTVTIGNQTWMAENLKTTRYNDGTPIPLVTVQTTWANLSTPAYCWYNNDSIKYKRTTYGTFYNWYAVNTGKLAPRGWHIPTDEEWTTLTSFLGGSDIAGGKLKETGLNNWMLPNTGATNETYFNALPCGNRANNDGTFQLTGTGAFWWTSTDINGYSSYFRSVGYSSTGIGRSGTPRINGLSVRCIKD